MQDQKKITSALISVYHKEGLDSLIETLVAQNATIYSTGGTAAYIQELGATVVEVADLTGYPSILGGRVKTLHPKVHGGILARRQEAQDLEELAKYEIPEIDLVVVDLYPFEETVASGAEEAAVIEKIDIGGIALIRAAAKNFREVAVIPSQQYYGKVADWLAQQDGALDLSQRKQLAGAAFDVSSHYDSHIFQYLAPESNSLKVSYQDPTVLRYGENPHQKGHFYGNLSKVFTQLHGKALSYNNLVDIEGALELVDEFEDVPFFAVIKHTNPCGCAIGTDLLDAWKRALAGDPVSAFGGILACNGIVDEAVATEIDKLFFEVLAAKGFTDGAMEILQKKKNRILLQRTDAPRATVSEKSLLHGFLVQEKDVRNLVPADITVKSTRQPTDKELTDVYFGDKVVKHLKSNAIALVKDGQLIGSGIGQTSRVDALMQAIAKAQDKGFDLQGSVLASDAFFPFADSVEIAHQCGVEVVVEPGGSRRDEDTVNFCETHDMCLIFTGIRHFKH
ncbi:MAG: bifunctional phosphoribosylaminoimidazolecarboxamide formyltransferase/IMP cyclohydrolase [Bacteroidota bacterium]